MSKLAIIIYTIENEESKYFKNKMNFFSVKWVFYKDKKKSFKVSAVVPSQVN